MIISLYIFSYHKKVYSLSQGNIREFRESSDFGTVKLLSQDLIVLWGEIKESYEYSKELRLSVATEIGISSITSGNIEDFINDKHLPEKLDNLTIHSGIYDWDTGVRKDLDIYFGKRGGNRLVVEGVDQIWVSGAYSKIYGFLSDKKPWYWFLNDYNIIGVGLNVLGGLLLGFLILSIPLWYVTRKNLLPSVLTLIVFIVTVSLSYLHFKGVFLPFTQIILVEKSTIITSNHILIVIGLASLALQGWALYYMYKKHFEHN